MHSRMPMGQPMKLTTYFILSLPSFFLGHDSFQRILFEINRFFPYLREDLQQFLERMSATFLSVAQTKQRVKRRLHHVMRIRRAQRLE